MKQQFEIEYNDDASERFEENGCRGMRTTRRVRKRCRVEISIDLELAAKEMGAYACCSKGKKCKDGFVTVKQVGEAVEISREPVYRLG